MIDNITGIILAGGKSSRMGSHKAFLKLGKKTVIEETLAKFKGIFKEIIVVANATERFNSLKVRVVSDIISSKGPLSGIYTGLVKSDSLYNFMVACDMPNLNLELIKYIVRQKDGFDVVVPRLKKGYETLFAVYSKNCLEPIHQLLKSGNLRVREFFKKVRVREIREEEIERFGLPEILFANINTPLDYKKYVRSNSHRDKI